VSAMESTPPVVPERPGTAGETSPSLSEAEQRVLAAVGDPVAAGILGALSRGERDVHSLVVETGLPQSSIYRKLRELLASQLVYIARLGFTKDGRKVEMFRSRVREIRVVFEAGRVWVEVIPSEDSSDRIDRMWETVRRFGR
jgi:DNA-binding transcriptional ArsR family regulator